MHGFGDADDLALKEPARVRVSQHDRCDVGRERALDRFGADGSILASGNRSH